MNVVTPESASSSETLFGGEKDYAAMYDMIYRATATKNGHMPDSESIIISAMAFVAKTEEKAIEEGKEHILFYF